MEGELGSTPASRLCQQDPVWRLTPQLDGTSHVTVLDGDGIIRYLSRPICHLLGLDAHTCVGRPLWSLLQEESTTLARKAVRGMAENETSFEEWTLCFQSSSGGEQWLEGKAINFLRDPRLGGIVVWWEPSLQEVGRVTGRV